MRRLIKYLIFFWSSFFILVLAMGITRHVVSNGERINGAPKDAVLFLSSLFSFILNPDVFFVKPGIIEDYSTLKNGFNFSENYEDSKDYLLVSSFDWTNDQFIVKLVRINDGEILHKWIPNLILINKLNKSRSLNIEENGASQIGTELSHPFLFNDGSLIFRYGGLSKVDKNSNLIWSNTIQVHHSIEQESEGNFWTCGYNLSTANSDKYLIMDDVIRLISPVNGDILFEKSVFEILIENGYGRAHFFIHAQHPSGYTDLDYIHLNDVQPVLTDSKYWKKGDIFLSLRNQNMVLLYRPSNNKIIWSQTGPWLGQHDVDIIDSTHIGVFGNNVIDANFPNRMDKFIDGNNTEYVLDFSTKECSTPYDSFFKSANIATISGGRARILCNGDIFVEETDNGRIIYGSHTEEIWSYIEKINKNKRSVFSWSRYITEKEFNTLTFLNQN